MTRDEQPRSTVEHLIKHFLPRVCHRFLLNQSEELRLADVILRALFGALSGAAMFAAIALGLPLTFDLKLATGCLFTGACVVGGATSSAFRCAVLLMFPSMLGSRGRTFLLLLVVSALYSGPVSNIQHNVETAAESLSCNLDLQVRNAKLLWRDAVKPFLKVAKEVVQGEAEFESEARGAHGAFADVRQEVLGRDANGRLLNERSQNADRNSTQERFALSTLMQCDGMVKGGIAACTKWFSDKWAECAKAIQVPVIKHILCVPMKFHFLCNIMRGQRTPDHSYHIIDTCCVCVCVCASIQGKRHLLPLTPSERRKFVDPWSPKIHPEEIKEVLSSVIQVLSVLLLALVLLTVDVSVFRVLDVVSKHTHTTFNVTSSQQVDIKVGGTSMMARLLRRTFSAFNTSSRVRIVSDNQRCVTTPSSLAASAYISVACCLLLAALFSCLQVYANRLRRVIAAFYHPRVTPPYHPYIHPSII
ncbi:DC-STAMP domain-containing protein 1 [Hippocampus comes]|uniref:DC-STAMP domain-containing protein 1 n=1 Tax=Hippocampus comes TaxID=109280 RepID=UPI00094EE089|nr:PREDICTED: DC-STAMP domain-containing protein 1 [Hippocampus comes]